MFDPTSAFIDCPKCDSARHVERVKGEQWFCNCCAHQFAAPLPAPEAGSLMGRVARGEVRQPTAALQFVTAVALVLLWPVLGHAQGRVVYDGFEGTQSPWSSNGCQVITTATDGGTPRAGGRMLRCNMSFEEVYLSTIPYGSSFLVRYWMRYDANVDHKIGSKQGRIAAFTGEELLFACQMEQGPTATLLVGFNNRSTYWGSPQGVCGHGRWFKVELARQDSGPVRLWVDDVLQPTPANWQAGAHIRGDIYIPSNWSKNPEWQPWRDDLNHVYLDEFEIYADTGTGATGSIMDGTIGESGSTPPPPPPPAPVDCAGTWGAWTRQAESESACGANGTRTFTEARLFTVTRQPTNGGAACPASPESRSVVENCVPPVQSVTYTCWVAGTPSSYADGDVRRTIRCDTNGPITSLPVGTTFTVTVPRR